MNQDDFKNILDESLKPIKVELKKHSEILEKHSEILEGQVLPSLATIETEIKTYADMYKINNSNAKKLEKRIEVLEDKSGIIPPPELTLVDFN